MVIEIISKKYIIIQSIQKQKWSLFIQSKAKLTIGTHIIQNLYFISKQLLTAQASEKGYICDRTCYTLYYIHTCVS